MPQSSIPYGPVRTVQALGQLMRTHRKAARQTLERLSSLSKLSMRFLSEFERGKETAEIGKVLQALESLGLEITVQPRIPPNEQSDPDKS